MAIRIVSRKRIIWLVLAFALVMLFRTSWPLRAEIRAIHAYQTVGSPVAQRFVTCRFEPTCSHYALSVLNENGFWKGNWKILKRLFHCSPLGYAWDVFR